MRDNPGRSRIRVIVLDKGRCNRPPPFGGGLLCVARPSGAAMPARSEATSDCRRRAFLRQPARGSHNRAGDTAGEVGGIDDPRPQPSQIAFAYDLITKSSPNWLT